MIRIILGVIVGFIAWTIMWLGSDYVLTTSLPWYANEQSRLMLAMLNNKGSFDANTNILLLNIARSVIASFLVGYLAAIIAGENRKSTLALGVLLLAVGIFFEVMTWHYFPAWYHFVFLFLLIPVTIAGGKLKKFSNFATAEASSSEAEAVLPITEEEGN
ncbi:MAG: hypothetical protein ABI999_01570 [Acidobacteriota bacterium]